MTENLLIGGDYVPDGFGGFVRKSGAEGLLCEVLFRLNCKRGSFPFLPELGSRLYMLSKQKSADRKAFAQQYCAEALSPLGLLVQDVQITQQGERQIAIRAFVTDGKKEYSVEVTA